MSDVQKALLVFSGGMDSTTLLWWMGAEGIPEIHTVSIDYGQRHSVELACAAALSKLSGVRSHRCLKLDLGQIGGNPLTDLKVEVPTAAEGEQIRTVVPYRNMLFVTMTAALAETEEIEDIFISPVRDDHRAYRDCRREFYDALEKALLLGSTREGDLTIHTPFVDKWKREVVQIGLELGVPYEQTHTCYEGSRPACGVCDACAERIEAFQANRARDPLSYVREVDWA